MMIRFLFYRGTSPVRKRLPSGPSSRDMPRALRWSYGGGLFVISEVPLYRTLCFAGHGRWMVSLMRLHVPLLWSHHLLQGYLAHEKHPPP